MEKSAQKPGKLAVGEIQKRLEKDPNNPIVLQEIKDVVETQGPALTIVILAIRDAVILVNQLNKSNALQTLVENVKKTSEMMNSFLTLRDSTLTTLVNFSKTLHQSRNSILSFYSITQISVPRISGLLANNFTTPSPSPFNLKDDFDYGALIGEIEPAPNYTSVLMKIETHLAKMTDNHSSMPSLTNTPDPDQLLSLFPEKNGKTRVLHRIMALLLNKPNIDAYYPIKFISPNLKRHEYERNKNYYLGKLENKTRALNRSLKSFKLFVSIKSGFCMLIHRNQSFA